MSVMHLEAVTAIVKEIFEETVMIDLILTLSKGHTTKLTSPLDWQISLCYMSAIHLKAVTTIVKEIFDEIVNV